MTFFTLLRYEDWGLISSPKFACAQKCRTRIGRKQAPIWAISANLKPIGREVALIAAHSFHHRAAFRSRKDEGP